MNAGRPSPSDWAVVIPVKDFDEAKTRMTGLSSADRRAMALALARSTIDRVCIAVGARQCFVVAPAAVHPLLQHHDPRFVCDVGKGLNAALAAGRDAALSEGWLSVALMVADLPLLTPAEVRTALCRVPAQGPALVRDTSGRGTTMLAARDARDLVPAFGGESARRHLSMWAYDLSTAVGPGLRQDLDDSQDLADVIPRVRDAGPLARWLADREPAGTP